MLRFSEERFDVKFPRRGGGDGGGVAFLWDRCAATAIKQRGTLLNHRQLHLSEHSCIYLFAISIRLRAAGRLHPYLCRQVSASTGDFLL